MPELRNSEKLCEMSSLSYFLTGASWETGYGKTYEIGVRSKNDPKIFILIQPDKARADNLQMIVEMTKMLLDGGFTPTEIQGVLA